MRRGGVVAVEGVLAVMGVFVVVNEGGGEGWLLLGEIFLGGRGRGVLEDCWSSGILMGEGGREVGCMSDLYGTLGARVNERKSGIAD